MFKTEYKVDRKDVAKAFGKSVEDLTKEDLLSLIPASTLDQEWETGNNTEFVLITERDKYYKKTILNRINCLWVYPFVIVTLPFKWVITGQWGYSRNTKFGRILGDLVGEK